MRDADGAQVTFAAPSGASYVLETSDALASPVIWRAAGEPAGGDDHLHTVTLPATGSTQFFRLRAG